ncbi:hypothetical protein NDU88_002411 [Pleurodeles waltl]|uniref:Uncharacterized protein n=1 Tax=Pleurodeles waltl TaxID=8319 RepID=A0AAV7UBC5_PLEWA|nr:hypothetical protein NDU88_002411 [Pleurodeles waltl]
MSSSEDAFRDPFPALMVYDEGSEYSEFRRVKRCARMIEEGAFVLPAGRLGALAYLPQWSGKKGLGRMTAHHTPVNMSEYEDEHLDGYYYDDPLGSLEQILVYAVKAGMQHCVNLALVMAIQLLKRHLYEF